jgi:hypothetical protein
VAFGIGVSRSVFSSFDLCREGAHSESPLPPFGTAWNLSGEIEATKYRSQWEPVPVASDQEGAMSVARRRAR